MSKNTIDTLSDLQSQITKRITQVKNMKEQSANRIRKKWVLLR